MNDVKIFDQVLINPDGSQAGKLAILVGGLNSTDPKSFMDLAVLTYVGPKPHNQFVEIHLDNPWTRVLTSGINERVLRDLPDGENF